MTGFRFGIRARLWLAFLAVAAMTVIASAVAWVANGQSGDTMTRIAQRQVPVILALSSLAQQSNNLIATAPALLFTGDTIELREQWRRLTVTQEALRQALARVREHMGAAPRLEAVEDVAMLTGDALEALVSAVDNSLRLTGRYRMQAEQIDVLQQEYRVLVGLLRSDQSADVRLLTETNRIMVMLGEVWRVRDEAGLDDLEQRVTAAFASLEESLPAVAAAERGRALESFLDRLRALAHEEGNVFELRHRDLQARAVAAAQIEQIRTLAQKLDGDVRVLLEAAQEDVRRGHQRVEEINGRSQLALAASSALALVVALVMAWRYVGHSVVGRLNLLARSMRAIAGGDLVAPIPTGGADELSDMARALVVFRDALAHVRHLATHDALTGLANRRLFEEKLAVALAAGGGGGAVFYVNLRGFKEVNDTFGHTVGDQVLTALADRLCWAARADDLAARLGGDDFVLLVPGLVEREQIESYLYSLDTVLSAPVSIDVMEIEIAPVVGIARYPHDGATAAELLQNADMAMHRAKGQMQTTLAFYSPEMGGEVQRRKAIRRDLRTAITHGQLELVYQPKVDMRSGAIAGMEALVRWTHPERGPISPLDFIPVAEQSGLILPLGQWVLHEGCRQARLWRDQGLGDRKVAINMSPVQVLRHDVVSAVRQTLDETGLPPHLLEIEITEGVLMQEEAKALQRLRGLRDLGVSLAIDDFGTGYSSLAYLKRLPVTCLKIDQSFVRDLTENEEDIRLNRVIIGMAHDFGLEVVAEGIETASHAAFLRSEGCDLGQGYWFSRPLKADAFAALLGTRHPWHADLLADPIRN